MTYNVLGSVCRRASPRIAAGRPGRLPGGLRRPESASVLIIYAAIVLDG